MIEYRFKEEQQFAKHYANKLNDKKALKILESGEVADVGEAQHLSNFFWRMVDAAIAEEKAGKSYQWEENAEFWTENLMYSISGYLEKSGYRAVWDAESDKQ
jgi:hypothetical protein